MRFITRLQTFFPRLKTRYLHSRNIALFRVSGLIRKQARGSMRRKNKPSAPGRPPAVHAAVGLKEINFHVTGSSSIIGPRKFANSRFFNRPVPNIHEKGGTAIGTSFRRRIKINYPERSFMYAAVKKLQRKGLIASQFRTTLRNNL